MSDFEICVFGLAMAGLGAIIGWTWGDMYGWKRGYALGRQMTFLTDYEINSQESIPLMPSPSVEIKE